VSGVAVPLGELIHEPGTERIAGLTEDEVECGVIEVAEVDGEALGWSKDMTDLLDCSEIAALRLRAGASGYPEDTLDKGRDGVDGVLDIYGVGFAVGPLREILGSVGLNEGVVDSGGEEVVPFGIFVWEPASGSMEDDLFFGIGLFTPDIELGELRCRKAGAGSQEQGPEDTAGGIDNGGRGAVDVDAAVPFAEDIGGLMETFGVGGELRVGMVDGVGEALGEDVVEFRVDVRLKLEHVGGGEVF
jgi:hypothetical protein